MAGDPASGGIGGLGGLGSIGSPSAVGSAVRATPIVALAAVLVGVDRLPEPARRSLAFEYGDPTLLTAYTAPFVHFSTSHLIGNVAVLLLAGGTLAHLCWRARSPWLFVGALAALASTLPVALTLLNLAVPRPGVTYGFSGVNMALVGFLPVGVVRTVEWRLGRTVSPWLLVAWFAVSTAYIAALAVPASPGSTAVVALSLAVAVLAAGRLVVHERRPGADRLAARRLVSDPSVVVGVGAWVGLVTIGFPRVELVDGAVTNVYVHFLGYALGFTTAYLAHELELVDERP